MTFKTARIIAVTLFLVPLLALLTSAQESQHQPDPTWQAPAEEAAKTNPLPDKSEAAAGGRKLFLRDCANCHGQDAHGTEDTEAPDLHLPAVQKQSDGALFWKISNGNVKHGMPAFSRTPEASRWQIVSYLRTLKSGSASSTSEQPESQRPESQKSDPNK
jgi:mono/diheme cytochrome c family protein